MTAPSPFEVSRLIGNNVARGAQGARDENAIERILAQASASGDPKVMQDSIGKILSQVSPERQPAAIKYLENKSQSLQKKQELDRRKQASLRIGIDPDLPESIQKLQFEGTKDKKNLRLNESLNQAEKRYKIRINNLKTPFEKRDAFGSVFLDFDQDEKKRQNVLSKLNGELTNYANELKRTYEGYGETPPQDILDQLKDEIKISVDGQQISMRIAEQINEFEKQFPAKEHKGESTHDDEGNVIVSDGVSWKLKE